MAPSTGPYLYNHSPLSSSLELAFPPLAHAATEPTASSPSSPRPEFSTSSTRLAPKNALTSGILPRRVPGFDHAKGDGIGLGHTHVNGNGNGSGNASGHEMRLRRPRLKGSRSRSARRRTKFQKLLWVKQSCAWFYSRH